MLIECANRWITCAFECKNVHFGFKTNINMATAGYSGTPLIKKLGIRVDTKLLVLHAPDNYFSLLEKDLSDQYCKKNEVPDLLHLFAANRSIFEKDMMTHQTLWQKNKSLTIWVSWYKKSSGMATDLTEDVIRNYPLANG